LELTVLPENLPPLKLTAPPENAATVKSTRPPKNGAVEADRAGGAGSDPCGKTRGGHT
jgi:hypothetical protein